MKRAIILLLLVVGCLGASAQSAYEQMMQIAGYSSQNVPPPSEPVCAVCRIPAKNARPWDHQPWCDYYSPRPGTQVQQPVSSDTEEEESTTQNIY